LKRIIVPFSNDDKVLREEKKITFLSTTEVSLSLSLFLFPFFGKKNSLFSASHTIETLKKFSFSEIRIFSYRKRGERAPPPTRLWLKNEGRKKRKWKTRRGKKTPNARAKKRDAPPL